MTDHYAGAGDGQCVALQNDGDRCTNGVYQSNHCCGTHKRANDPTLAPNADDRTWCKCPECGWQPADYAGPGTAPVCSHCGVDFPMDADRWDDTERVATDGGTEADDQPRLAEDKPTDEAIDQYDPTAYPTRRAFHLVNDAHSKLCVAGGELEWPQDAERSEEIADLEDEAREAVMDLFRALADERGFNDAEFENVYLDAGSKVWERPSDMEGDRDD